MNEDKLREIIMEASVEVGGRMTIACAKAFMLASEYSITVREIGDFCTSNGIKITSCQLGCF